MPAIRRRRAHSVRPGAPARHRRRPAARPSSVEGEALDPPAEARLQLAPLPALQQVALGLCQQELIPGLGAELLARRDREPWLRQTLAGPPARIAPPGGSSRWRHG